MTHLENSQNTCCSGGTHSCTTGCSSNISSDIPQRTEVQNQKNVQIDFLFLDLEVCIPCRGTDQVLLEAVALVNELLEETNTTISLNKINIISEEMAKSHHFLSSPTIRINGRDIQLEIVEGLCESCGTLCGGDVDCRVWTYHGKEYKTPPKAMLVEAILSAVSSKEDAPIEEAHRPYNLPSNLQKFFNQKTLKDALENL